MLKNCVYLYFYHDLQVMTLDSFNAFTVTDTSQSVLWKYRLWYVQYAVIIHLSAQVQLIDLETLQVIVKSNW